LCYLHGMAQIPRAAGYGSGASHPPSASSAPAPPAAMAARKPLILATSQESKKRLRDLLGGKFDAYFEQLAKFLNGISTKQDLDEYLTMALNDPQRKAHNLFILTILRSASSTLVSAPQPTLQSAKPHLPTHYMPRPVDYVRTRDIKMDGVWGNVRMKLSQRFRAAGMVEPSFNVVTLITLALEHYLKSLLALTTTTGRVAHQTRRELEEEEIGRGTLEEDLMEVDEVAQSPEHAAFLTSLAATYSNEEAMQLVAHRREGVIVADDLLALGDAQSRVLQGHAQALRVLSHI